MGRWTTDLPRRACRPDWEQNPETDDGHRHVWHMVVIESYPGHTEPMTVCKTCTAPRCGNTFEDDPCLSRRHHSDPHIYESGLVIPVGGTYPLPEGS